MLETKIQAPKRGRGRPRKVQLTGTPVVTKRIAIKTRRMSEVSFDPQLFVPMMTNTKVDRALSGDEGLMKATAYAMVGDPGVGKSTVALDILAELQKAGQKCLFISGEMKDIDMEGYCRRFPKFRDLDILFMGDYSSMDPLQVLEAKLNEGWDVVLMDSFNEVKESIANLHGGTGKAAESKILDLVEKHNNAKNKTNTHTTFLLITQVTKGGTFAGSNRFKHMLTGMFHMKFDNENNSRYFYASKNRRGGEFNKFYFDLNSSDGNVKWLHTDTLNMNI